MQIEKYNMNPEIYIFLWLYALDASACIGVTADDPIEPLLSLWYNETRIWDLFHEYKQQANKTTRYKDYSFYLLLRCQLVIGAKNTPTDPEWQRQNEDEEHYHLNGEQ